MMQVPDAPPLSEEQVSEVYLWVDEVPLSRPKKLIARDFSDGVLVAEVVQHFLPRLVDVKNYVPSTVTATKVGNWRLLNRVVLTRKSIQKAGVPGQRIRC